MLDRYSCAFPSVLGVSLFRSGLSCTESIRANEKYNSSGPYACRRSGPDATGHVWSRWRQAWCLARGSSHTSAERILEARFEAALLFLLTDFQPILDEDDAGVGNIFLHSGAKFEELAILLLSAKAHDALHAGAVVPTAVEDDNFTSSRKMRHVTLHVHLGFLAVGRSRKCDEAEDSRTDPFGDGADRAAFAGGITALEDDHDSETFVLDPVL